MNIVIQTLKENIDRKDTRFVFPSQIAAERWARKACTLGIARSVAGNRFLAWDRFKEEAAGKKKREPVSKTIRELFAGSLVKKNAEAAAGSKNENGFPFESLIPVEYAAGGNVFVPFLARLLPSLAAWEKLAKNAKAKTQTPDPEDRDFALVKKEYAAFLDRHNLFEPSWEEVNIIEGAVQYLIFFPELIEDFSEYAGLLQAPAFTVIHAAANETGGQTLLRYQSVRDEIRGAVLEIESLHTEGVPYEDMAVSVPELEAMESNVVKEFRLRHIPIVRRAGKPLGETGAGRLFRLMNECAVSRFSFNSLKALLLDDHIPWRNREKNKALVQFGIDYNCVSGYTQNNKTVDIWEEAFKKIHNEKSRALWPYYRELKKQITAFTASKSFGEIRKNYFAHWNIPGSGGAGFLDMETISANDDAVLSRCIEELGALIELEEKFNDAALVPSSPFGFFISHIGEKDYVKDDKKTGVNIFKWRVAAACPFAFHAVLNASQTAAPVLYRPLAFLRQDKRKALGLEDTDATGAFFSLCGTGDEDAYKSRVRISASTQTFSGWTIPHSYFAQGKTVDAPEPPPEPYADERRFWKEGTGLPKIYSLQNDSFNNWCELLLHKKNHFTFFNAPFPRGRQADLVQKALPYTDGILTVTPTNDLNVFYECPVKWLFTRVFKTEEFLLEAALLDDISLGILYHNILEALFANIKDEDGAFNSGRLNEYKNRAMEITVEKIENEPAFQGPLALPLVLPQAAGMWKKICALLDNEAALFDKYRVGELELSVSFETGDILIKERIDRVSISPAGAPVIIDYKTNALPSQTDPADVSENPAENPLGDFQMPLYIMLYEEKAADGKTQVESGYYYSIKGKTYKTVVGEKTRANSKTLSREEYTVILEAAEKQIKEFGRKVKALDLAPPKIRFKDCAECTYKTACRSVYLLN